MPPPRHPPSPTDLRPVHPSIWRACAGSSVQIPTVNSRVYYFPQGHVEQSCSPTPLISPLAVSVPLIHCRIADVQLLADPLTDEVFAKLLLHPVSPHFHSDCSRNFGGGILDDSFRVQNREAEDDDRNKIVAFAKILTPSDANNGGGFSVPRFCADSIFPPLNYHAEPPVQNLSVTDVHGEVWAFRHIYRGTPRRHLLTTGWSKFVNHKKLVAGDSVVFMKNQIGGMFVGIRRAVRPAGNGGDCARWRNYIGGGEVGGRLKMEEEGSREGFSRSWSGRVPPEAVVEAAERAVQGLPFEVVYYPRAGSSDFVVRADAVEMALNIPWTAGMRVKMAMETEDSSRMTWFQGTVASAVVHDSSSWQGSPWRMLQVTWDEPEVLQSSRRVSPWQVELVAPTQPFHTTFPPAKKLKFPQNSGLLTDEERGIFFPMSGLSHSTMGHVKPSLSNYSTFPAGMQGARQDTFSLFGFTNLISDHSPLSCIDNICGNNMVPKLKRVSTELNIGSSQSDNLSPDSQSSMQSFGTELVGKVSFNSAKAGVSSIQLFGKIIHMKQPVEDGFHGVGCMEDDGSKVYNQMEGANNQLDLQLTYSELLNRLDDQCQGATAVEACPL